MQTSKQTNKGSKQTNTNKRSKQKQANKTNKTNNTQSKQTNQRWTIHAIAPHVVMLRIFKPGVGPSRVINKQNKKGACNLCRISKGSDWPLCRSATAGRGVSARAA
jgi:hypothetical protein